MVPAKISHKTETDQCLAQVPELARMLLLLHPEPQDSLPSTWVVSGSSLFIGRDPEQPDHEQIALAGDNRTSRRHARIEVSQGTVAVHDLGSKNGTYVNGKRVNTGLLSDGDVLRIGNSLLLFRHESEPLVEQPEVPFLVQSSAMRALVRRLATLGPREETVLLLGESGVGKEVFARALHRFSGKQAAAFYALNCSAIPTDLAESILFGHVAGAYSGARTSQDGFLRAAGSGTLFFDEIGDLPPAIQPKLLRALEERLVTPVGSTRALPVNARIIAATNVDLRRAIQAGTFRSDLFARLGSVIIEIPPLRLRREEILPLFRQALRPPRPLSARLAEALVLYPWPLNVRELLQLVAELNVSHSDEPLLDLPHAVSRLQLGDLCSGYSPQQTAANPAQRRPTATDAAHEQHRDMLERLLCEHHGIIARVAQAVRRSPRQVRRWMADYGLRKQDYLR